MSTSHRKLGCLLLLGIFSLQPALATELDLAIPKATQQSISPQTISLEQALDILELDNPGIAEMAARAEAMATIPSQAGSLPDPVISMGLANLPTDTLSTSQEAMTQWQLGISQSFPYPGKLALAEAAAGHMADAASFSKDEYRVRLRKDLKTLWWRLFYLDKTLGIVNINKTLLRQFIDIAQTKYKVGQGLQQDVLLAQLELSKLIDREIQLKSQRSQEQSRFNALLSRPTSSPVELPKDDKLDLSLPGLKPTEALLELAREQRPALAQQQQMIAAAKSRKQLAEKELLPDFKLSAGYGKRQGNNVDGSDRADFVSFNLGVELPLFAERKQKMAISQRNKELKQQQFALLDQWNAIQADISSTISAYQSAREQQQLLQSGIIPQARQTVASMLSGYQVNKVDFLNLVRAQITLYDYEITLWRTISQAKTALAELTAYVGEEHIHE